MKFLWTILISIFCLAACDTGNNTVSIEGGSANDFNVDGMTKSSYEDHAGWEHARVMDKRDKLSMEGELFKGKRQGSWITYHTKNGLVESIQNYENGVLNGPTVFADDRGNVTDRMFYVMGKLNGEKVKYNRSKITEQSSYLNGELHGKRSLFYPSGKIQEESDFVNGKREGKASWYDEQGELKFEYNYKNGERLEQ